MNVQNAVGKVAIDRTLLRLETARVLTELGGYVERIGRTTGLSSEAHMGLMARLNDSVGNLRETVTGLLGAVDGLVEENRGLLEERMVLNQRLREMSAEVQD